jgi:hypothetical protein
VYISKRKKDLHGLYEFIWVCNGKGIYRNGKGNDIIFNQRISKADIDSLRGIIVRGNVFNDVRGNTFHVFSTFFKNKRTNEDVIVRGNMFNDVRGNVFNDVPHKK